MSNPIDEYFKKHLTDVEVKPRKDLFADKIAPRIEQRKAGYFFSPWLRVAAAVVLLFASWQILQMVNTPMPEQIILPDEKPVAVEQSEPKSLPKPEAVSEAITEEPRTKPRAPKGNGAWVSTTPAGSAAKNLEAQIAATPEVETAQLATTETKTNYKVKLHIDPAKYAAQAQEVEIASNEVEETQSITEYAAAQFDNFKDGDKLQTPPKEWFELPKLAVRVDGNPLKRVLPGKE